jgi:hypothetical protein
MTKVQSDAIRSLENAGYAVIIWTPEELGEVCAQLVEDCSIELGHQIIGQANDAADMGAH